MNTSLEPQATASQSDISKTQRIGRIVRWAARITSLPIFGMLMISLVPALSNFGVSAKDDRIIALGMCATALGFILAWGWPGIGGVIAAVGVGAMLSQADGSIFGDPFSVAFGLQAILFLISWALNSTPTEGAKPRLAWMKRAAVCLLMVGAVGGATVLYRGPGPTPLPKEKAIYAGVWESGTGFIMEIADDGRVRISQNKDPKVEPCNNPLGAAGRGDFLITFPADDRLELTSGLLQQAKLYHIDRRPFRADGEMKLVLNGSDPYNSRSGLVLVKKQAANPRPVGSTSAK